MVAVAVVAGAGGQRGLAAPARHRAGHADGLMAGRLASANWISPDLPFSVSVWPGGVVAPPGDRTHALIGERGQLDKRCR